MHQFFLLTVILFNLPCFSQDTIYAPSAIETINGNPYLQGAHLHSHDCCEVGCNSCTEINIRQKYDTIFYPVRNGIQRITVIERYYYAHSNEIRPVHFRFRKENGGWSKKYYCAEKVDSDEFRYGYGFYRYPKTLENRFQEKGQMLIMDESQDFSMIDLEGNEHEIPFLMNKQVSPGIFLSTIIVDDRYIYGFSDGKGNKVGPLKYTSIGPFNAGGIAVSHVYNPRIRRNVFTFYENKTAGLVNCYGKILTDSLYSDLKELGLNRYAAGKNGAFILIDTAGKKLSQSKYLSIAPYSEGLSFVQKSDSLIAYIDRSGKELIQRKGNAGRGFHNGLAAVYYKGKWGFIDKTGKLVIAYRFETVKDFKDGIAIVEVLVDGYSHEWKLINKKGVILVEKNCQRLEEFKGQWALMEGYTGSTLINTKGKELFPPKYSIGIHVFETADSWFTYGMLIRSDYGKDSTLEAINEEGKQVLNLKNYIGANFLRKNNSQGYGPYIQATKNGIGFQSVLDLKGNLIFEGKYNSILLCADSVAAASVNAETTLIDLKTGAIILTCHSSNFEGIENDIIKIRNTSYGYDFYNLEGEKVLSF